MRTKIIERLSGFSCIMLALCVALSAAAAMAETAGAAKAALSAAASSKPRFSIYLQTSSILTEGSVNDTAQGPGFTVTRRDGVGREEKIGWRVVPATLKPVSAEDFECGELPSGELVFLPDYIESETIYFGFLPEPSYNDGVLNYTIIRILNLLTFDNYYGLKKDDIKEGDEFFTVQLYDLDTDEVIPADYSHDSVIPVLDELDFIKVDDNFYKLVK